MMSKFKENEADIMKDVPNWLRRQLLEGGFGKSKQVKGAGTSLRIVQSLPYCT